MKKKIIFILCAIIIFILLILISNKTFFKTNYMGIKIPLFSYYKNSNTLYSIRSFKKIDEIKNEYFNHLETCYDESYYYDKDIDKSIIRYEIQNKFLKRIIIEYEKGNICDNEYVLMDDWYKNINVKEIIDSELVKCKNNSCDSKKVNINLERLISDIKKSERIDNDNYLSFDYKDNNNYLGIYLSDDNTYSKAIKVIPYKKNIIGIIVIEDNDSKKNALYKVDIDSNKYINTLVNN